VITVACDTGCDSCIMMGAGKCDGPQCADGYYINANFLCTSQCPVIAMVLVSSS